MDISSETGSLNSTRYTVRTRFRSTEWYLVVRNHLRKLHKAFARHKVLAGIGESLPLTVYTIAPLQSIFHENIEWPSGTEIQVIRAIVGETIEAEFTVAVIRELV